MRGDATTSLAGAKEATGQPYGTLKGSGASMAAAAWQRQLGGSSSGSCHPRQVATAVASGNKNTSSNSDGRGTDKYQQLT
jgi:hypothetical protein